MNSAPQRRTSPVAAEKLLEELSFSAPDISGQQVRITQSYVRERLADVVEEVIRAKKDNVR